MFLNCGVFFIIIYFSLIKSKNEVNIDNNNNNKLLNVGFVLNRVNKKHADIYEIPDGDIDDDDNNSVDSANSNNNENIEFDIKQIKSLV